VRLSRGNSGKWGVATALVALAMVFAACGSALAAQRPQVRGVTHIESKTISMAEQATLSPNYLMPVLASGYSTAVNSEASELLWPALYFFGTGQTGIGLNESLSLAYPPVYSHNDTVVTVTLKPMRWSDGADLTSRDVIFFMNLIVANKNNWGPYVPGQMPDDVTSYRALSARVVQFKLNASYNPVWFTDDQLSLIVPIPQQSWDRTSPRGPVGNYDETAAGARKVFNFLNSQAKSVANYDTNPLWRVVDGPWRMQTFSTDGELVLVPNTGYSGKNKARVRRFELVPFTSDSAEFSALLAGDLNVGYVPITDLPALDQVRGAGYTIVKGVSESINFASINFDNPTVGSLAKLRYVRQVLNRLMDQQAIIKNILGGYGYPDYGPIPPKPASAYLAASQTRNPYPYSVAMARKILLQHGWHISANGRPAVCVRPGAGRSDCGPGVPRGKVLEFNLVFESGIPSFAAEMETYKSAAGQAGVVINLRSEPFDSIISAICVDPTCISPGWEMLDWGGNGSSFVFNYPYPASGALFGLHEGVDYQPSPQFERLINYTYHAPLNKTEFAMRAYDAYAISEAPVIWQPLAYTVYAVSNKLRDIGLYASGLLAPQNWYFAG